MGGGSVITKRKKPKNYSTTPEEGKAGPPLTDEKTKQNTLQREDVGELRKQDATWIWRN